jgi:hypothetical protein
MTMNSIEGRVRAALRGTADEIRPHDVPPLAARQAMSQNDSASPVTPTGNWRPGFRQRWGLRQWAAPLAATVAVLAVVAAGLGSSLIVGTGTGQLRNAASNGTVPAGRATSNTTAPPPPYGSVATLTRDLADEFLTASGPQYTAGAQFMSQVVGPAEDTILARCLAAHGFSSPPGSLSVDGKFAGIWDLSQFPDLNALAKAGALPGGETVSGQSTTTPSAAEQAAFQECAMPANDPFAAMSGYGRTLDNPFLSTVLGIQSAAPQVQATIPALRGCASKYGWPRDSEGNNRPLNTFGDFVTWVTTFLDGPQSRGASDATMRALRRHWGPIFVECARPTVTVMESLQLAARRSFLATHQPQLSHLVSLAITAFNQATKDSVQR